MKQGLPSEANVSSDRHEICCILRKPKIRYRVYKILPLDRNLSHLKPVHALTSFSFQGHFNIILPSTPSSTKSFFPLGFPAKTLYIYSLKCSTCPSHAIFSLFNYTVIFNEERKSSASTCISPGWVLTLSLEACSTSKALNLYSCPVCKTKFHTHTEEEAKL